MNTGTFSALIITIVCAGSLMTAGLHAQELPPSETIWLETHNTERKALGIEPLGWSYDLANDAASYAEVLAASGKMTHSTYEDRGGAGENLWTGTAGYFTAFQMIESFLSERAYFKTGVFPEISTTGNWQQVGHYTQIIWRDTRKVGCALAKGKTNDFLVCRYWPAGNRIGTRMD